MTTKTPAVSIAPGGSAIASPSLSNIQNGPEPHINLDAINTNDYTIGWIAALPLEEMAARMVLNHGYQTLSQVPLGDINRYVLGAIREHKIVLAVMPDGEYGKSSALSIVTHMLRTFPNIRVGFMVGVGGGAPSREHDIRMGDVVVSRKGDGKGGVFEFDYGKKHQAKSFEYTSHLNSIPTSVRNTIAGLGSPYKGHSDRISREIDEILTQNRIDQNVRAEYERPREETDILFKSTVVHNARQALNHYTVLGAITCVLIITCLFTISISLEVTLAPWQNLFASLALAAGAAAFVKGTNIKGRKNIFLITTNASQNIPESEICDKFCKASQTDSLVNREARDLNRVPRIHYGLIGSSDQLMKDAVRRDELTKEHGVLCFEMEAAGLMNRFPCLVVRGICDYSDSHKNENGGNTPHWQPLFTQERLSESFLCSRRLMSEGL